MKKSRPFLPTQAQAFFSLTQYLTLLDNEFAGNPVTDVPFMPNSLMTNTLPGW